MGKLIPMKLWMMVLLVSSGVMGVQPNSVQTTTYDVDGNGSDVVTTEYSDGLGRSIQSKLKISDTIISGVAEPRDRVTCTFYDDAGRPEYTTKSFVDREYTWVAAEFPRTLSRHYFA
jgi:hypothetical protein